MENQEQQEPQVPQINNSIECSHCGQVGGPTADCDLCHGNQTYVQERHYTLTEERAGKNPNKDSDRYGRHGEVGPKIVLLPGGAMPGSG